MFVCVVHGLSACVFVRLPALLCACVFNSCRGSCYWDRHCVINVIVLTFHFSVVREIFTELQSLCPGEAEEINSLRKCYRT